MIGGQRPRVAAGRGHMHKDARASPDMRHSAFGALALTILFTAFIAAVYAFGVYLFPALIGPMREALSLSYSDVGGIMAASQLGFLSAALASGALTRIIGPTRLIFLSVLVCGTCLCLVPVLQDRLVLHVLLFVTGGCSATVWVPMVVVAKAALPERHQGKALGLMSSGTAYGIFVNGLSIPLLLPAHGWTAVWYFSAALTGLLFLAGCVFVWSGGLKTSGPGADENRAKVPLAEILTDPIALMLLGVMLFNGISCMPTQNYLASFVSDELQHGVAASSDIWKILGVVGMFGGFAIGVLADMITVRRATVITYLVLAAALALFVHHGSLWQMYLGAALFSLAFNAIFGLIPAYISLAFPARLTTPLFGLGNVMLGTGAMIGNYVGGVTKDVLGSFVPVFSANLVIALCLALVFAVVRERALRSAAS